MKAHNPNGQINISDAIARLMSLGMSMISPDEAQKFVCQCIAKAISEAPDGFWSDTVQCANKPCEKEGCNCRTVTAPLFNILNDLRDEWKSNHPELYV